MNDPVRPSSRYFKAVYLVALPALILLFLLAACGIDPAASPVPTLTPTNAPPTLTPECTLSVEPTECQLHIFNHLWETVRDTYVYPDFNGLDWDAVQRRYAERISAGLTDEDFYQGMREMIGLLGDEHSVFISPAEVAAEEEELAGLVDYVGIGVYLTLVPGADYAVLLQVFSGSPAAEAGLQPHDRILAVEGVPVVDARGYDHLDLLLGPSGTEVRITAQTPGRAPRELTLTRTEMQGQLQVQAYRFPGTQIGYMLIPTFWDETIAERVRQALEGLMSEGDLHGLVVDMRINGGGSLTMMKDTLALFTRGTVGTFVSREVKRGLTVKPRSIGNSQTVPLVVLVGSETVSFGEIWCGVLQEQRRAHLIGRTTGGNVEILWPLDLEDGSRAWIASETFRPPSGADWEQTGIRPDQEIRLDWDEFTPETDLQLQAALEWLQ